MCQHLGTALGVIKQIASSARYHGLMLNERYLHHFFSHTFLGAGGMLDLCGETAAILLHPEWPTCKEATSVCYGRYRCTGGKFLPLEDGTAGFIDFAIGEYARPKIGIEFSLKAGWADEEVTYDFVKLLDARNSFEAVISFNVILRPKGLSKPLRNNDLGRIIQILNASQEQRPLVTERLAMSGKMLRLFEAMNAAYEEAENRLQTQVCEDARRRYFLITELAPNDERRHWYYDTAAELFRPVDGPGLPPFFDDPDPGQAQATTT